MNKDLELINQNKKKYLKWMIYSKKNKNLNPPKEFSKKFDEYNLNN